MNVLISVYDKTGLGELVSRFVKRNACIYSTGKTYDYIGNLGLDGLRLRKISELTDTPEMLGGRVKTLHPKVMGGILADTTNPDHIQEMQQHDLIKFNVVVANLYPFKHVVDSGADDASIIENIDIGGPTLVRSAAKNFACTTILTNPNQYIDYLNEMDNTIRERKQLAAEAFKMIAEYDNHINGYFNQDTLTLSCGLDKKLKYGMNPSNTTAYLGYTNPESRSFSVLNGTIGYINVLDALGSWRLVNEIEQATRCECAASFKHTIPTGVAINRDFNSLTETYKAARSCDPLSSFGDFIAISGVVDKELANYIKTQVTDGIIACDYTEAALSILKQKKKGNYVVLKGEPIDFTRPDCDVKVMNGVVLTQDYDNVPVSLSLFGKENCVSNNTAFTEAMQVDLLIATVCLKYAQSNSVAFALNGQLIGLGAGQQNRIDCIRLAGEKAKRWLIMQNASVLEKYKAYIQSNNITDSFNEYYEYIKNVLPIKETNLLKQVYEECLREKIVMSSDGFLPFDDNVEAAQQYNVKAIANPGGSVSDEKVFKKCDEYKIIMFKTNKRFFFH